VGLETAIRQWLQPDFSSEPFAKPMTQARSLSESFKQFEEGDYSHLPAQERAEGNQEHHLDFVVQSAYVGKRVKLPGGIRKKKVTFRTLVTKALAGARPKRPP
jgi:hypothetical protein